MTAMAVLIGLIFLMSGSGGGLFARKLRLRAYFENAAGLKDGAPVTLEGVTIGNVIHVHIVPERKPKSVEVTMQVGQEYLGALHKTTTASIAQAGVLEAVVVLRRPASWATVMSISARPTPPAPRRKTTPSSRPQAHRASRM